MKLFKYSFLFMLIGLLSACGSSEEKFIKSPLDELIKSLDKEQNFTVLLYDMDLEDNTFSSDVYKHRYKVIIQKDSTNMKEKLTDWELVSESFFQTHINDMGMEVASKQNGKVSKVVSPPGYSQYVGNEKYGSWQKDSSGGSFWQFYGQYAFMRSMFGLGFGGPIYRTTYTDYGRYRGAGKPYYGGYTSSGSPRYGTYSSSVKNTNPDFARRVSSNSSFNNKVNRMSRSSASASSGARSKTSRSGSRYGSSSSSSRSRSSSSGGK